MTTMTAFSKELFTLRALKTYPRLSTDSEAFSATLYFDGKKFADVIDDGHGGCVNVRILDRSDEKPFYDWIKAQPERRYEADVEFGMEAFSVPFDGEHLVEDLVGAELERRDWVKACKKGIVFTRKGEENAGKYWTIRGTFSAGAASHLREKIGDELDEIINERFIS